MLLKKLMISDFKGIRNEEIKFSEKTMIAGHNASGKSTIATAYSWLFFDKDIDLNSNPPIAPIGVAECLPTVTAEMVTDDGKPVTFTKIQKRKVTDLADGTQKIALSNTYEVNNVPVTERDFRKKLDELGFPDSDIFLACSNTEVFVGMKQTDMRKILFGMVTDITDSQVAEKMGNIPDVVELLNFYSVDEISAMNKATVKKANEQSEAIPNQIIGLESAKVNTDGTTLKKEYADAKARVEEITAQKTAYEKQKMSVRENQANIIGIEGNINAIKSEMDKLANQKYADLGEKVTRLSNSINTIRNKIEFSNQQIEADKYDIKDIEERIVRYNKELDDVRAKTFDETNLVCSECGRPYEPEMAEKVRKNFENNKAKVIHEKELDIADITLQSDLLSDKLLVLLKDNDSLQTELKLIQSEYDIVSAEYNSYKVITADYTNNERYNKFMSEKAELEKAIESVPADIDDKIRECVANLYSANAVVSDLERKLGELDGNDRIDAQIRELNESLVDYEMKKANAEKILYQLDLLSREKNKILSDVINSNFNVVNFKLFEFLKNGNYKEVCSVMVGDKELGKSMNTALEMNAKLDIINGLQTFYGVKLPVFVDGAECMDSANIESISVDNQLILLKVADSDLTVSYE